MDSYELFHYIKVDIEKKYGFKNAKFKINGEIVVNSQHIIDWIDDNSWDEEGDVFWVKYKHVSGDFFELKAFPPDPPEGVCEGIVNAYIDSVKNRRSIHSLKSAVKF